jgi:P-type conjugative transfer ATPase TrbB
MTTSATVLGRQVRMLRTAMGPIIAEALEDPDILEILLNPDGMLWFDRLGTGRVCSGLRLGAPDAERIIRLIAAHVRFEVHSGAPIVSAELPESGERFEGLLPPVVRAPTFAIRKRAAGVIRLAQYVADEILTEPQALALRQSVRERRNIIIAGGTSTGKTTLANALLQEIAATGDRVILLEDTVELQCSADDHVALRTKSGVISMSELVRSTLRLRPDRIVVGEVRGAEALDLLKAWGTGHPGGIATIHAGSASGALTRLEQLIQEAVVTVPRALIAEAVDLIVFICGRGRERRVDEIVRVTGLDADAYRLEPIPGTDDSYAVQTAGDPDAISTTRAAHSIACSHHPDSGPTPYDSGSQGHFP